MGEIFRYQCTNDLNCPPYQYHADRGNYKLECWGAQGGNITSPIEVEGGKGAYASGKLFVDNMMTLYIYPGQKGMAGKSGEYSDASFGQGGQGYWVVPEMYHSSGGGMTFIATSPGNESGILFAAGGGGSSLFKVNDEY